MDGAEQALLFAFFFFTTALFFWLMCIKARSHDARILAFWYAVVFEGAGYISLAVSGVTF